MIKLLLISALALLTIGCSTTQNTSLKDAQDACFSGEIAHYQSVTQEQRINLLCK